MNPFASERPPARGRVLVGPKGIAAKVFCVLLDTSLRGEEKP